MEIIILHTFSIYFQFIKIDR